jgi:hypothetical protein
LDDLLVAGGSALQQGDPGRAADMFGRALLMDPDSAQARRGAAEARAALAEGQRLREARLAEAETALTRGDTGEARLIVEGLSTRSAGDGRVQDLRDRLDGRAGRVSREEAGPFPWPAESLPPPAASRRRGAWSRLAVAAGWAAGFGLLATGVATSWESLVVRLERTPMPQAGAGAPVTAVPQTPRGERLLVDARRLLDAGDAAAALMALDQVAPEEPAYPLARKLRDEAERLRRTGGRRP